MPFTDFLASVFNLFISIGKHFKDLHWLSSKICWSLSKHTHTQKKTPLIMLWISFRCERCVWNRRHISLGEATRWRHLLMQINNAVIILRMRRVCQPAELKVEHGVTGLAYKWRILCWSEKAVYLRPTDAEMIQDCLEFRVKLLYLSMDGWLVDFVYEHNLYGLFNANIYIFWK